MGSKHFSKEVKELHIHFIRQNPGLKASSIAAKLGTSVGYIQVLSNKNNLTYFGKNKIKPKKKVRDNSKYFDIDKWAKNFSY